MSPLDGSHNSEVNRQASELIEVVALKIRFFHSNHLRLNHLAIIIRIKNSTYLINFGCFSLFRFAASPANFVMDII